MTQSNLGTTALARDAYVSEEWHRKDLHAIWHQRWLFAGHASQISKAGDFTSYDLAGSANVLIVRGRDGQVRAFHNVCRHRGARLCAEKSGTVKRNFVCQYHAWSYGPDGSLTGAPKMPESFDKSQWGAKPVWCEIWNGLIFINMSESRPPSVAEELAEADLSIYQLDKTKVVKDVEYVFECNWKLLAENFYECYHCAMNHPELCRTIIPDANLDVVAPVPQANPTQSLLFAADASESFKPGVRSMTMDGDYAVKRLLGDPADPPTTMTQMAWFPAFQINGHPDWFLTESWRPLSPTKSVFRATWIVHEDAVEGVDYSYEDVVKVHSETLQQDTVLMSRVGAGVESDFYVPGPMHPGLEHGTQQFIETYLATIEAYEADAKQSS